MCMLLRRRQLTAGSAPARSPTASRCTPSGPAAGSVRIRLSSAGSTELSVPSRARSSAERPFWRDHRGETIVVSRSSLQLRSPSLRHNAAAAS
jgi:hypothetical protein